MAMNDPNPTFTGTLLFINHDANNLKALPHRRAVFTHVQGAYYQWKRREDARRLRASVRLPQTVQRPLSKAISWPEEEEEAGDCADAYDVETDHLGIPISSGFSHARNEHSGFARAPPMSHTTANRQISHRVVSPRTILQKGNSDPFSTFSIEIDPKVNDLIIFHRVYLHPAIYTYTAKTTPASEHSTQDMQDIIASLHNKSLAYAYLSRSAYVISTASPNAVYAQEALVYKNRSSTLLRTELALLGGDSFGLHAEQVYRSMFMLCLAELFAHNFSGAAVHMKMLSFLFRTHQVSGQPFFDLSFLFKVVYNDVQRAAMSLTRPYFDIESEGWVCEQFAPVWAQASIGFPDLSRAALGLDASVDNDTLQAIFVELRKTFGLAALFLSTPSLEKLTTWLYIISHVIIWMGRLINHYVDFMTEPSGHLTQRAYDQAYMSLAALYWTRAIGNVDSVPTGPGAKIYEAGPTILAYLRDALTESKASALPTELSQYSRARFWALYVGAQAEQSIAQNVPGAERKWFTREFAEQAKELAIISWPDARSVLQGFLYSDRMQPHGSQWFWKVVNPGSDDGLRS